MVSTGLTVASFWLSGGPDYSTGRRYYPPVPPIVRLDPAGEARLAAYQTQYEAARKEVGEGRQCELIYTAFRMLTPNDFIAGRNVRLSTATRIDAITGGQDCADTLKDSDKRFGTLEASVSSDGSGNDSSSEIASALAALNKFDRSRTKYVADENIIAKASASLAAHQASAKRITTLTGAVAALQADQSPGVYVAAADARRDLIDYDWQHLSEAERSAAEKADLAGQRIGESRLRLQQVGPALAAAENSRDEEAAEQLVTVTTSISSFDEALASNDEKVGLAKARARSATLVWKLLSRRLAVLQSNRSETGYRAVADLYALVKNETRGLSPEQEHLRFQANQAVEYLNASNARLQALTEAAAAWSANGKQARRVVLSAYEAVIPDFDKARFNDEQARAWETLESAEAILLGPKIGLRDSQSGHMFIYVVSTGESELDEKVAAVLAQELRDAQFLVTDKRAEAALVVRVSIDSVSRPQMDETSGRAADYVSRAELNVSAQWVGDDTMLIPPVLVEGIGEGAFEETKREALANAIRTVVSDLVKHKTKGQPPGPSSSLGTVTLKSRE